jgi:hypothetical protein
MITLLLNTTLTVKGQGIFHSEKVTRLKSSRGLKVITIGGRESVEVDKEVSQRTIARLCKENV